jgi:DNA-binding MarR family transcriptional regulator
MTISPPSSIPQEEYVIQILRAARRLEKEGDRLFIPHRLTVVQFNVLNVLRHYEPMPQADLVRMLVVGKATVSSVLGGLLKRRLIIQAPDRKDRRAKVLRLSPEGAKIWQAASKDYVRGLKRRLPSIGAAEVGLLSKALAAYPEDEPDSQVQSS